MRLTCWCIQLASAPRYGDSALFVVVALALQCEMLRDDEGTGAPKRLTTNKGAGPFGIPLLSLFGIPLSRYVFTQLAAHARGAQLGQRLGLDLASALAANAELDADLAEGRLAVTANAKAHL
jgi:hypothetical protein